MASHAEDQAAGLRRIFSRAREPVHVAFAGSRGAAGRGALVAGLARALAASGKEVVVVDENPGTDSVAAACGIAARFDLLQAVHCDVPLAQVLLQPWPGVRIVPAARAARECGRLDGLRRHALEEWLRRLHRGADFVLTDTSGHAGAGLTRLAAEAPRMVIVAATNSLSVTEAYAQLKRLAREDGCRSFDLVVARAAEPREGETVFANMREVARRHLGVELHPLGCLPARGTPWPACQAIAEALQRRRRPEAGERLGGRLLHFGRGLRNAPHPVV